MRLNAEQRQNMSGLYIKKALKAFRTAEYCKVNYPDFSISSCYYSMFYAAQGILVLEGFEGLHKHKAVNDKFNELFVKTGEFPEDVFNAMERAERDCYEIDFNPMKVFTAEDAEQYANTAEIFMNHVEKMIDKRRCMYDKEEQPHVECIDTTKRKDAVHTPMTLRPIALKNGKGELNKIRVRALEAFVDKLKERIGDNLLKVVLFGSVARGDSQPDSDVDVFVLMKDGTHKELVDCATDIAADVQLEEGECKVFISPLTVTLEEYIEHKSFGIPVYHIIDEEGIVLYDAG